MSEGTDVAELRSEWVKTALTPTEYIALAKLAERLGLSQSAAIRMWVLEAIERHSARDQSSLEGPNVAQLRPR